MQLPTWMRQVTGTLHTRNFIMPTVLSSVSVKPITTPEGIQDEIRLGHMDRRHAEMALVRGCLRNDPDAMRCLVETYQADVYGLCVRLLADRHEAEDVAQEVFVRVLRGLRGWDANRPLKPWIMGAALNRCRTYLAKRARRPQFFATVPEPAPVAVPESARELNAAITEAVEDLRADYREVFVQFHERGLSYEAISGAMRRSVGTIKTWLHRARIQVLQRLRERGLIA